MAAQDRDGWRQVACALCSILGGCVKAYCVFVPVHRPIYFSEIVTNFDTFWPTV